MSDTVIFPWLGGGPATSTCGMLSVTYGGIMKWPALTFFRALETPTQADGSLNQDDGAADSHHRARIGSAPHNIYALRAVHRRYLLDVVPIEQRRAGHVHAEGADVGAAAAII